MKHKTKYITLMVRSGCVSQVNMIDGTALFTYWYDEWGPLNLDMTTVEVVAVFKIKWKSNEKEN